jgi:hypothetical protein
MAAEEALAAKAVSVWRVEQAAQLLAQRIFYSTVKVVLLTENITTLGQDLLVAVLVALALLGQAVGMAAALAGQA